jgi:hypothetical protein
MNNVPDPIDREVNALKRPKRGGNLCLEMRQSGSSNVARRRMEARRLRNVNTKVFHVKQNQDKKTRDIAPRV